MRARSQLMTVALLTLLITVGAAPGTASAAEPHRYAERVDLAGGAWIAQGELESSDLTIRMFTASHRSSAGGNVNRQPGLTMFYRHLVRDPATNMVTDTNYEGFAGGANVEFRFDPSLRGADATATVPLYGYRCVYHDEGPQGIAPAEEPPPADCVELAAATVTVDLTWAGVGDVMRDVHRFAYDEGPHYRFRAHTVQAVRDAQLTGTVAGDGLELAGGLADVAILLRGAYHEHALSGR